MGKRGKQPENLTGQQFGSLIPIEYLGNKKWKCECHCGRGNCKQIHIANSNDLKSGNTKTCGCQYNKKNYYELSPNGCVGYTSKNEPFYFDLEDYDKIKDYYWYISNYGYVMSYSKGQYVLMHRIIMNALDFKEEKLVVDHINHFTNDNRKINLRLITHQQNSMNKKKLNEHMGVFYDKTHEKWVAEIGYNNENIKLGYFKDIEKAIEARKQAEEKYFGEFAYQETE